MNELQALIHFWKEYRKCPETAYLDLLRERIDETLAALARLQSITGKQK